MHVRSEDVLGMLIDILVVHLGPEDGRTATGAAADAHARDQLKGRDDGHRKAPAAHCLATEPRPEETCEGCVHQCDDAADAGEALDAREQRAAYSTCSPCRLRVLRVALHP